MNTPIYLPLLVFLGIVGVGLLLKRILPAGASIHLPKYVVVVLIGVGVIVGVLMIVTIVVLLVASH